jgi:hypothetical protein
VDLADQLHCQRCLATPAHARKRQCGWSWSRP